MKRILLWMSIVAAIVIAYAIYRARGSTDRLDVAPDAQKEIDKARKR